MRLLLDVSLVKLPDSPFFLVGASSVVHYTTAPPLTDFCIDSQQPQIYNPATMQQRVKICAYCNHEIHGYRAISRRDNKTFICAICSVLEARHELALWQAAATRQSVKH